MVSRSNIVFFFLIIFSLFLQSTARLRHKKPDAFLQTMAEEDKLDQMEELKQKQADKELEQALKAQKSEEWDNNSLVELQLNNFLTVIADTNSEYLTPVKKEEKKEVVEDKDAIWRLTAIEKHETVLYE